ncbi:hypothetical protein T492DRAFT_835295 [Pavlovales sp. CCMP2436]|nr:hypothetical protein T492DRAFT_835295 [Pavlovales sp. CCMP2436]
MRKGAKGAAKETKKAPKLTAGVQAAASGGVVGAGSANANLLAKEPTLQPIASTKLIPPPPPLPPFGLAARAAGGISQAVGSAAAAAAWRQDRGFIGGERRRFANVLPYANESSALAHEHPGSPLTFKPSSAPQTPSFLQLLGPGGGALAQRRGVASQTPSFLQLLVPVSGAVAKTRTELEAAVEARQAHLEEEVIALKAQLARRDVDDEKRAAFHARLAEEEAERAAR